MVGQYARQHHCQLIRLVNMMLVVNDALLLLPLLAIRDHSCMVLLGLHLLSAVEEEAEARAVGCDCVGGRSCSVNEQSQSL